MPRVVLVLNVGSSSVKFAVAHGRRIIVRGGIDHFGNQAGVRLITGRRRLSRTTAVPNTRAALTLIRRTLADLTITPTIVAHRVVHGGTRFSKPTRLSPTVIRLLEQLVELAPLHQPANLLGVSFSQRAWPEAVQWAVFDTAIYRQLPEHVRTYALPRALTRRLRIEKYGFHGTSHAYAFQQAAHSLHTPSRRLSVVTLHLGAGASMTVWQNGRPVDTTMGFTPLEGLVMATRSGDIDPAIPLYLQEQLGWSAQRVQRLLIHESGLVGISGLNDMRDILDATGHPVSGWPRRRWTTAGRARARLALAVFIYHIRRTLAGYVGLFDSVSAIVWTGPIGQNRTIRQLVLHDLPAARGLRSLAIPADEEQGIVDAVLS